MKHIYLLVAILSLSLQSNASWQKNIVKFREAQGRKIMITIDGKNFPKINQVITIGDVPSGTHYIKVYRAKNGKMGYAQGAMIYKGVLNTKGGRIYRCTIDSYAGMNVQEYCCIGNNGYGYEGDDNGYYDNNWYDQEFDQNWPNNNTWNNNNNNNWNGPIGMSNNSFQSFKQVVANADFENSKETIIKQQLANNWISAQQLRELLSLFSFENNKLSVVRNTVSRVVDPQNLFFLYDEFTFDNNKRELAQILSTVNTSNNNNNSNSNNNNWNNNNNNNNWNDNNNNWDNNNWNNNSNNNWNNNNNYGSPMNGSTFSAFKQTVSNNNFDSGKLSIIKQQMSNQWITSNQLKELVDLFTFESSKLDAAKMGAARVVDRQNLFLLYNSFTFENNKKELADFIKTLN